MGGMPPMVQPFQFGADSSKRKKKKSNKQEMTLAQRVGGKTQAGSGNQWHSRGDVQDKEYLIECKYTQKKSFSISVKLWQEITDKAFTMGGKTPAVEILLGEGQENLKLIVLSEDDYLELRGL
jgi:hypothetical protein